MKRIHVRMTDGTEFSGETAASIVSQLRDTQWNAPAKKSDYMNEVADRLAGSTKTPIATENADVFLQSLIDNELVVMIESSPDVYRESEDGDALYEPDPRD